LKIGMDILANEEHIHLDSLIAQGGLFRTPKVGQQVLADSLNTPITVTSNAGEGGPWGMAVLGFYVTDKDTNETLEDFLDNKVFADPDSTTVDPDPAGVQGSNEFIAGYKAALPVEGKAVDLLDD